MNMRVRLLAPRVIDPVTGVLRHLYRPRILATMLVAVLLAHEWLYLVHGVGRGVQALLVNPMLLFPVLAIMPLAALVHEFGHASALRYGGGQVRGIGAGFYLIYPAFYTDVTDAYRLGRWARVRTDLGGLYFALLFTLVLMAVYQLTGSEFLLLAVFLIDLDTAYQLLPFVRLDGYWAFADLIGVPDPLSQTGAFLRSAAPQRLPGGSQLPALKPRVRVAYLTYLLAAIPVLLLLSILAIMQLPRMLGAEWQALVRQAGIAAAAQARGDIAALVTSAVYALVLALLLLGTAYLIYTLVRAPVGVLWRASRRARPVRC